MKKFLITLLLVFTLGCHRAPKAPEVKSPIDHQHATTYYIRSNDVLQKKQWYGCSATAVGPSALLTAGHCRTNTNLVYLNSETDPTVILADMPDGADHVIYIVRRVFTEYAQITQRPLKKNEWVHFWGNPGDARDIWHSGYYTGIKMDEDGIFQRFVLGAWEGDSGASLFDESGNIVAVVSLSNPDQPEELSLPLQFTRAQLLAIQ